MGSGFEEIVWQGPIPDGRFLILKELVALKVLREGSQTSKKVLVVRKEGPGLPPCT